MALILVIIQIIAAIPSLISAIKKIIEMIQSVRGWRERRELRGELFKILLKHRKRGDQMVVSDIEGELEMFAENIRNKYGID